MVSAVLRTILVTGGAGYIGSHTVLQLLLQGFRVVVVDSLDNASEEAIRRVRQLANNTNLLEFRKVDLRDKAALEDIFSSRGRAPLFEAVIHFAGLKVAVGESVEKPLLYYDNNLIGTITLLQVMAAYGCKKMPCTEEFPLSATSPYSRNKDICRDLQRSDPDWKIILLEVLQPGWRSPEVRDYINVVDLADNIHRTITGAEVYNLGTGKGTSVLENGCRIEKGLRKRKAGDAETVRCTTAKAEKGLKWKAKDLGWRICRDLWNWASKNPYGYGSSDNSH
ncbi:hypothetical protein ZWY2020_057812 [Hordeum vulgare]|nr:hypothetical protein ZWY2020_057812 [Hordeum vulgare]